MLDQLSVAPGSLSISGRQFKEWQTRCLTYSLHPPPLVLLSASIQGLLDRRDHGSSGY